MNKTEASDSIPPTPQAKPLEKYAYRAAVYNAASILGRKDDKTHAPRLFVPTLEKPKLLATEIREIAERVAADPGDRVMKLINCLRLTPAQAEYMLIFVMSAVNFAANRHKVKAHLSDTDSLCKEQATTLEAVLAKLANQPGVLVLPSEREAVAKLAASLRYQGEKREADQARLSQKLDTPSAVVMTAARKIHHYVGEGYLPKLEATEIAVLLSGALGCDVAPATVREALRRCGDFPSTKRPKSRDFEKA
ncbi:hypothetical protein [Acidocella sp.]|uniref:hypothetical protein n=1 Tax=Acidocella sp. TaxID=50710 RepID=UPI003D02266D